MQDAKFGDSCENLIEWWTSRPLFGMVDAEKAFQLNKKDVFGLDKSNYDALI